ncbi:MAG: hypothetical protein AB7O73_11115 [Bacteroidia bacterium]
MKNVKMYFILFCTVFFSSCMDESKSLAKNTNCHPNVWEIIGSYGHEDTVNVVNCNGKKQGQWVPSSTNKLKDTVFYLNDNLVSNN